MSSVVNVQNVVECLNVMMMNSSKKKIGEEVPLRLLRLMFILKNVFRKWNIDKMFSSSEVAFLGKVIAQFQEITGKSVNYPCFLHNYFEMVPSECWPHKKEIMESISHHLPKTFAGRRRAKQEFEKWWSTTSSPTPTFVSN